ncbi:MAG: hypothetical protein VX681_17770 [Myxococcota bacterium]|nr:hypothetical protein [Myxococcota bacterium]
MRNRLRLVALGVAWTVLAFPVLAAPDHPVITEVYTDPPGLNDGPLGRDLTNVHQEYIEIYLPTLADLDPGLAKDSLDLTLYEVEGDTSSPELGLVNYRIDLPTFDLDPSNGLTGLPRPPNGSVVLGWVDYVGNPPTGLVGTPATRVALIDGGVTSTPDFTFIAINGNEFSGTTNFPTPSAISVISAGERSAGLFENGSSAFLLVDRDDPGYVQLWDAADPCCVPPVTNADSNLPAGSVLGTSSLLDAFASNDDPDFDVLKQPYSPPTGNNIDLETELPAGGAFSNRVPQLKEVDQGYALLLADIGKTTDDALPGNDNPVADALGAYRTTATLGPFVPTPGFAPLSTDAAQLSLADDSLQVFQVLAGTTGGPGMLGANIGGSFGMRVVAVPRTPANPSLVSVAAGPALYSSMAQEAVFPVVAARVEAGEINGASTTVVVDVSATRLFSDPPVVDPLQTVTATIQVLNPTSGLDAGLNPFQAPAFVAVQGLAPPLSGTNEFVQSTLGGFVATHLGGVVRDDRGNAATLLNPLTDLGDPVLIDTLEQGMPDSQAFYINPSSGVDNLVSTVVSSAERVLHTTYDTGTFNASFTAVRAIELGIPDVRTSGGVFTPIEPVHFADAAGGVGNPASGLSNAVSERGFELALVDSNVLALGGLETGESDDFGIVVEIGLVRAGASVVPGEFVFLNLSGGLQGADVDTLDVPPHGNRTTIIYIDLDPLDTTLGALTVSRLFLVDAGGSGSLNLIEAFVLNADGAPAPAVAWPVWLIGAVLMGTTGILRLRAPRP